jgi:hypothetical protein
MKQGGLWWPSLAVEVHEGECKIQVVLDLPILLELLLIVLLWNFSLKSKMKGETNITQAADFRE